METKEPAGKFAECTTSPDLNYRAVFACVIRIVSARSLIPSRNVVGKYWNLVTLQLFAKNKMLIRLPHERLWHNIQARKLSTRNISRGFSGAFHCDTRETGNYKAIHRCNPTVKDSRRVSSMCGREMEGLRIQRYWDKFEK